jgi:hypothetical protein
MDKREINERARNVIDVSFFTIGPFRTISLKVLESTQERFDGGVRNSNIAQPLCITTATLCGSNGEGNGTSTTHSQGIQEIWIPTC